jgi:hypothetical protein
MLGQQRRRDNGQGGVLVPRRMNGPGKAMSALHYKLQSAHEFL